MHRHNDGRGAWEEYRYDALGRRVMVIARLGGETPGCDLSGLEFCNPVCTASATGDCEHKVTWQVWDGDQLLREERRPYPDGAISSVRYGIVHYVHGLELDHPLAVLQDGSRILNPDWKGLFDGSVTATGAGADCAVQAGTCDHIPWPSGHGVYARSPGFEGAGGGITHTWAGSLLLDGQDGTGNMYRRNRYYDPVSGRFTQEDPIGLAGGTNLYGFANGDPVNFSDPFGLCPSCFGAAAGVASGFVIAKLTGADYGFKEAAIDASLGAVGAGIVSKLDKLNDLRNAARAADDVVDAARGGRNVAEELVERATPGRDGGRSRHIIEKVDGKTNSVTHQVEKNGEIIHQHTTHIGKEGTKRRFPDEWTGKKTIDR